MHSDQAEGLRALKKQAATTGAEPQAPTRDAGEKAIPSARPVRVIAVTSGKGGVGKTNVSVNLGVALSQRGKRVLLMDADMGLANVDIMLGLSPKYNLSHVLDGVKSLKEVLVKGPAGIQIIPAASGVKRMAELSALENAGIVHAFSELADALDVLIVDTAAGIASSVATFCQAAQEVVVVVCDEPASLTDAYALIKVLNQDYQLSRFHILANMTQNEQHGRKLFLKLATVTEKFLNIQLKYLGTVPYDAALKQAVRKQVPVTLFKPDSSAAQAFTHIAQQVERWPMPQGASGHIQFFIENLFQG
ncbi:MAG TPA: MinD/ParA family protein [Sulfurivirga caldicuralii]|nr:MinD/ParA family protein [Sulfurivirga caldicuralii]